jgi:hypothetical protein
MIGNRVRAIVTGDVRSLSVEGELRKLDAAGATIYRHGGMPETCGLVFIPMQRIIEIVDLGRMP